MDSFEIEGDQFRHIDSTTIKRVSDGRHFKPGEVIKNETVLQHTDLRVFDPDNLLSPLPLFYRKTCLEDANLIVLNALSPCLDHLNLVCTGVTMVKPSYFWTCLNLNQLLETSVFEIKVRRDLLRVVLKTNLLLEKQLRQFGIEFREDGMAVSEDQILRLVLLG